MWVQELKRFVRINRVKDIYLVINIYVCEILRKGLILFIQEDEEVCVFQKDLFLLEVF